MNFKKIRRSIKLFFKKIINAIAARFGLVVINLKHNREVEKILLELRLEIFLNNFPSVKNQKPNINIINCKSQYFQDIFVIIHSQFKKGGFFVEFGAYDGVELSNTYLLEKDFGWNGILSEPSSMSRFIPDHRSCQIHDYAVYNKSNLFLEFIEDKGLSTLVKHQNDDGRQRSGNRKYVETITLMDLLRISDSPKTIDYLSIDTEGSELEILIDFDFSVYDVRIITVEHNNVQHKRKLINNLLISKGFQQVHSNLSVMDDWYVKT